MRNLILTAIFLHTFLPMQSQAQDVNAGFVQGLWYSEEEVFAGVPTRIYVALRNNTEHDLTGTVRFTIDGERVGSSDVRALSGRLVEAWVDWTPKYGSHTVTANLTNAELHVIGDDAQRIDITSMVAEDTLFVDIDTDKDSVGDQEDTDDDNDTVSDEDEKARGTDPLVANPIPVDAEDDEDESESVKPEELKSDTGDTTEAGLERFVAEGKTNEFLSTVTEKIEDTKKSLDMYRANRIEKIETAQTDDTSLQSTVPVSGETATITRSRLEPKVTWFEKFVSLAGALVTTLWSFVLLFFSFILGFPALIEVLLLWIILIAIYRTARRFGQRRRS